MENERLLWELEQMRSMADVNEVTRLRSEIDGLRQEMLHMANCYKSLEVIRCCSNKTSGFHPYMHTPFCICVAQCGCHVSWQLNHPTKSSDDLLGLQSGMCA